MPEKLREDWFVPETPGAHETDAPGIFEWLIGSDFTYIGKATSLRAVPARYAGNLQDMLDGKFWHNQPKTGFRGVHDAMLRAIQAGEPISFRMLETGGDTKVLNAAKARWLEARKREGGRQVLNGLPRAKPVASRGAP